MVGFVVEDEDIFEAHEIGQDALDHLAFGFEGVQGVAAALQEGAGALGEFEAVAELEGVIVGDDDLGAGDVGEEIGRDESAGGIEVAVRLIGMEYLEAVLDGEAGGDDEEAAGEGFAPGMADGVDGLPGDEHGHDGGFAGSGGEFEGEAEKFGIRFLIDLFEMGFEGFGGFAEFGGDFEEPDGGFDGFDLAEEGADASEVVAAPVLEEAGGFGRDEPIGGVGQVAPLSDEKAEIVDDGSDIVLLLFGGEAVAFVEGNTGLAGFAFFGRGNGRDEFCATAGFEDAVGGLAVGVEFPVAAGEFIRGVENRVAEKVVFHGWGGICWEYQEF